LPPKHHWAASALGAALLVATPFKMAKAPETTPGRFVFENSGHDYPQRVTYWVDERGPLHAGIEGTQGGAPRTAEWVYTRVNDARK
jgi:hypothetical protein